MKLRNSVVREREMERKVQLAWNPFAVEKTHYFHRDYQTNTKFDYLPVRSGFCCSVVNDTNTSRTVQKKNSLISSHRRRMEIVPFSAIRYTRSLNVFLFFFFLAFQSVFFRYLPHSQMALINLAVAFAHFTLPSRNFKYT